MGTDREQEMLQLAKEVATKAHEGQKDKGGQPYILHPTTVASYLDKPEHKMIAYLHDVCEDTPMTIEEIQDLGFSKTVTDALRLLTRKKEVPYEEYVRQIAKNPNARLVKLADLRHNMDLSRISHPTEKDYRRLEKYKKAYEFLQRESVCQKA